MSDTILTYTQDAIFMFRTITSEVVSVWQIFNLEFLRFVILPVRPFWFSAPQLLKINEKLMKIQKNKLAPSTAVFSLAR